MKDEARQDLPFRADDIRRGLILFRTSNNAHGHVNFVSLTEKVRALPQTAKDELAAIMRNMATELDGDQQAALTAARNRALEEAAQVADRRGHVTTADAIRTLADTGAGS